jgi:hypothetical protein
LRKLNDAEKAAKCVEISKCLIGFQSGLINLDLGNTQTIGDAARLAVRIRGQTDDISRDLLAGISTALKVDFRIAESKILPIYEELGWVDVKWSGKKAEQITEKIPPTEDILSKLGQIWEEQQPTPIDEASVKSLAELSKRPFIKDALISELEVKDEDFDAAFEYGEQAKYLGKFVSEEFGKETVWTPLYWTGNMDEVTTFLKKQTEPQLVKIGSLVDNFRVYAGTPDERIVADSKDLVNAGIAHGFFPSVLVRDRSGGKHEYIFAAAPQFEADPKSDVFEKARMIVSCIRHGQHHAEVSPILYPTSILRYMRASSMNPHPYADIQYAILVLHGVVTLEETRNRYQKAFKVNWVDTPENNLAFEIAMQLLRGNEVLGTSKEDLDAQNVLVQGVFNYSSEQRRLKTSSGIVAKKEYDRLMELVRGVKR